MYQNNIQFNFQNTPTPSHTHSSTTCSSQIQETTSLKYQPNSEKLSVFECFNMCLNYSENEEFDLEDNISKFYDLIKTNTEYKV